MPQPAREKLTLASGHTDTVWSVSFSPDAESKRILSASFDKTARIWDTTPISTKTGPGQFTLTGHTDRVNGVAFSPDGRYLASSSWDDEVRLWDGMTGREVRRFKGHTGIGMGHLLQSGRRGASPRRAGTTR